MKHKKSYGCIPVRGEKGTREVLLVMHHEKKAWGFPKGGRDAGESEVEAALRELREETGLASCELVPDVSFADAYHAEWKGEPYFKEVLFFLCHAPLSHEPAPEQGTEIAEALWFSFSHAYARITYDAQKRILKQVAVFLDEPL